MANRFHRVERPEGEHKLLDCQEVQDYLQCSEGAAYKVIRDLNEELAAKGYYTIRGRVSMKYLKERFFGAAADA